ncbi:MAG: hypothetical protein COV07_01145 [Candidatus Vogelbacteria bacterium CG10_big_fil_rev_8_21_14_0_10_45_14]|uniref:Toxin HicA n=1 Tax=Candidatus Vogelbacteria bacterium CG10_big_fil_rev_8_21_14_0_10_45_14 TaxID=1975042 RepID=A0A2H0RKN9_9BACT|nr:MAG: hypothetical protein COV07_01145 [Candidatus Vogelbacteria bacterium CG10_big_fil_rev_8_21_14_0_10_45_14]
MSSIDKLQEKLTHAKGEVALKDVERLLNHYGFYQTRIVGSHFHFEKDNTPAFIFPVHNAKVMCWYVRLIIKKL